MTILRRQSILWDDTRQLYRDAGLPAAQELLDRLRKKHVTVFATDDLTRRNKGICEIYLYDMPLDARIELADYIRRLTPNVQFNNTGTSAWPAGAFAALTQVRINMVNVLTDVGDIPHHARYQEMLTRGLEAILTTAQLIQVLGGNDA